MPELPEVQTTVNGVKKYAAGFSIRDAWTDYGSKFHAGKDNIANPKFFSQFRKAVVGAKIIDSTRRGKNVLIHLSNKKTILIHMKMTGHVMYGEYEFDGKTWVATKAGPLRDDPFNKYIHFLLSLSNGNSLVLSDMRKFAKVTLIDTEKIDESSHISAHGPEPLEKEFDARALRTALEKRPNMPIKQALMNHELVSGIGNIYSDEILWLVGIHPLERVKNIPEKKWPEMHKAMRKTLMKGIDFGGDSMSDYRNILGEEGKFHGRHNAYRRTGEKCRKLGCKGTIRRLVVGGRSGHFCDVHQKLLKKASK